MSFQYAIHDVPVSERPRERFRNRGAFAVSSAELLAIALDTGCKGRSGITVAEDLLMQFHNLSAIEAASVEELSAISGIGITKAIRIKAAIELGNRFALERHISSASTVLNSEQAFKVASYYLKGKMQEHLLLFCLNVRGVVMGEPEVISIGILDASCVHPREVFRRAIQKSAAGVLLAHNHPSGSAEPSDADIESTRSLCRAGDLIGISLLDHVVISDMGHVSIRKRHPELFLADDGS